MLCFHPDRHKTSPAGGNGSRSSADGNSHQTSTRLWRDMEGPSFYCAYLGFTTISKPPTSMAVLQTTVRDMYYKYRKSPTTGRSASLRLTQRGVLVVLYDDGVVKGELFFDFGAVVFVEAARFAPVKTSSERKPKAFFVPVDQQEGGGLGNRPMGAGAVVSEKHAFLVEKSFHFLVTSSHPPLVVCVVRRPQGVKALDCHVFALDTVENALHISALVASAQTPAGMGFGVPGVGGGRVNPGGGGVDGGFDKARGGGGGDVIRTEYGEYSVYRGSSGVPGPDGMMPGAGGGPGAVMSGGMGGGAPGGAPPGGRNGYLDAGVPGGIVLTQDNFVGSDSSSDHQHQLQYSQQYLQHHQQQQNNSHSHPHSHHQYAADVIPGGRGYYPAGGGGGMYGPGSGPLPSPGYHNHDRPPDVIMHARPMSGGDVDNRFSHTPVHDRSFGAGSSDHGSGVRMRHEDVGGGGDTPARLSGGRVSGGQASPRGPIDYSPHTGGVAGTRVSGGYVPPGARPMFPGGPISPSDPTVVRSPASPLYHGPPPPTSPRGHDAGALMGGGREVFSASNRESRAIEEEEELGGGGGPMIGGKPVAKVPPHFKAGIKVLPSDFRMVKLKHKPQEDKKGDSFDEGYDNNKIIMERYKEAQEVEWGSGGGGVRGPGNYPDVAASTHMRGEDDGFRDFSSERSHRELHEDHSRDFRSRWGDAPDASSRVGGGAFYDERAAPGVGGPEGIRAEYRNGGGNGREDSSTNRNRYSTPVEYNFDRQGRGVSGGDGVPAGVKSHHSAYNLGAGRGDTTSNTDSTGSGSAHFKDLEIANMFSNFRLDNGGGVGGSSGGGGGGGSGGGSSSNSNVHTNINNNNGYNKGMNDLMASTADHHDFESGLGYLP